MVIYMQDLPVDLVGTNVLGYLSLKDIVMLERACGGKTSRQTFLQQITYCAPVSLLEYKHSSISALNWFSKVQCKIHSLTIDLPGKNPGLYVKNLHVDHCDLEIDNDTQLKSLQALIESNMVLNIRSVNITGNQNRDVIEQLSVCTGNVKQLDIRYSYNCMDWLNADILSRWKLEVISIYGGYITLPLVSLLVQTCTELTSLKLKSDTVDDAAVIAIAQHCPKLETLLLESSNITWTSLLALSERGLSLEELDIDPIPNIPTADIARRCSHALSCIRHIRTYYLNENRRTAALFIQYMTELTSICVDYSFPSYIPLLTQYCHKLTVIVVRSTDYSVIDILPLCHANPLLQEFHCYVEIAFTDTTLIELIHACPHLHTLRLPYEINITDIGIQALSEHCTQLQALSINKCNKVTEAAVLHLLQHCRMLTSLWVSNSSLSEETWTQLDKNTQKRVRRQK